MREIEISCEELRRKLDAKESFSLIDCRTPSEHAICHIAGATLIPLQEFVQAFEDVEVEPDLEVVVYCHHGVRSLNAASYLRQLGFTKAVSVAGGIDAWSIRVDPSVPRY